MVAGAEDAPVIAVPDACLLSEMGVLSINAHVAAAILSSE